MRSLSIVLPDHIAQASQEMASKLGISRSQFIRQAISRELEHHGDKKQLEAMVQSFAAMKNSKSYLKDSEDLLNGFGSDLTEDNDGW